MRRVLLIFSAAALLAAGVTDSAQAQSRPPDIAARFVPDSIAIGDHFELEVVVDKDLMQIVDFPSFGGGMLTEYIEILEEYAVDTLSREGRRMRLAKRWRLTTFEEGEHPVGQFPVLYIDKNIVDTLLSSEPLVLQVGTFDIDLETMTLRDIKPLRGAPLTLGEVLWYLLGLSLIYHLFGVVVVLLWRLIRRRKRRHAPTVKARADEPPHVAAIRALQVLHNQKLWQNNKHKQYYTRLTDILREYLHGRYGIAAPEMTTEETLSAIAGFDIPGEASGHLRWILTTADLAKFAKFTPTPEENETAYTNAYYFVENTKPTEVEATPADPDEELKVEQS
ncbi:MAG: hypothetical protein FWE10_01760 [Rikenellaceae bacterium]|nr:hypothetical protein [Rikenellaceae bacterium]MCL2692539.1 hypothetical protein [Rikenellaceae bacterium]